MKFNQTSYTVGSYFLSAMINGDYSGLNDQETRDLNDWLQRNNCYGAGHWSTTDETDEYGRCDITGLRGSVETVIWNEPA
jgi:hypothetical protein